MTDRTELPELATRAEAADALRVSVRTVDRLIESGKLAVVNPTHRAVRVTVDSIHELLAPGPSGPTSASSPADADAPGSAGTPVPQPGVPAPGGAR